MLAVLALHCLHAIKNDNVARFVRDKCSSRLRKISG